jgi:hypothetical protein
VKLYLKLMPEQSTPTPTPTSAPATAPTEPVSAYENKPSEIPEQPQPVPTRSPDAVVHGSPEYQQSPEQAIALDLPSSIRTIQVDTGLPQSEVNVSPQNPYELNAPAILPKDVNPRVVAKPSDIPPQPVIPTSESHLAGQPQVILPEKTEDTGKTAS